MASLNLCPKPGIVIAPHVVVTPADPVIVEQIKARQEKERKDRHHRTHQERMARLISIKNRGKLYPPKPIELIDLASDDECKVLSESKRPSPLRKPPNGHLVTKMLQSSVPVANHTNSNYPSFNLYPTNPVFSQDISKTIGHDEDTGIIVEASPYLFEDPDLKISSNFVMNYGPTNESESQVAADEAPDFILGDLLSTDSFGNDYDPPDGNNNLNDSFSFPDDFNPQDFVAAQYGTTEEDIILID